MSGAGSGGSALVSRGSVDADPLTIPDGLLEQTVRAALAATVRKAATAAVAASLSVPLYVRATTTWCPEWYRHAEGIYRLEALWRAWEQLRLDPALGASARLLQHADPHMRVLLDSDGPFRGCTPKGGTSAA